MRLIPKNHLAFLALSTFLFLPSLSKGTEVGKVTLSFGGVVGQAYSLIHLTATQGPGLAGGLEYRLSDFLSMGLDAGMIEFLHGPRPSYPQDMKSVWLDLFGRFHALSSPFGEAYLQLGGGVAPHLALFPDYFPNYTTNGQSEEFYKSSPGTIYWNLQTAVGYFFNLDKDWGLDTAFRYDYFWPPEDRPLQTLTLSAKVAWSFSL